MSERRRRRKREEEAVIILMIAILHIMNIRGGFGESDWFDSDVSFIAYALQRRVLTVFLTVSVCPSVCMYICMYICMCTYAGR